jgi:PAS domain S-box-containing protein
MSDRLDIGRDTLQQLQQRAEQAGCSVDALLARLLAEAPPPDEVQTLKRDQAILRAIFDSLPFQFWVLDASGTYILQNTACIENWGDRVGKRPQELDLPEHLRELWQKDDRRAFAGEIVTREVSHTLYGERRDYHDIIFPFYDGKTISGIIGMNVDITERRQAEAALRQSESQLTGIIASAMDAIITTDASQNIILFNAAAEKMFGCPAAEVAGQHLNQFIPARFRDIHIRHVERFKQTGITSRQSDNLRRLRALRHNGEEFPVEAAISQVTTGGQTLFTVVLRDITEREHTQHLALNHERLKARFKKEEEQNILIQRTISALNHDLRTPFSIIANAQYTLAAHFDQLTSQARQEKLNSIQRQLQYALELLEDTVTLVRGNLNERDFNPVPVNLAALCRVSVEEIGATCQATHRLLFVNTGGVATVAVDEILVSRILVNLLTNAIKYSPQGGDIRLEVDASENRVVLRVTDQGIGISDEELRHIFKPFYRSESVRSIQGSGLGLSIVKDCVERHQGRIAVESTPGTGSTFVVDLPTNAVPEAALTG